jgi:hypothetical protein
VERVVPKVPQPLPPALYADLDALAACRVNVPEKAGPAGFNDGKQDIVTQVGAEEARVPPQPISDRQTAARPELVRAGDDLVERRIGNKCIR